MIEDPNSTYLEDFLQSLENLPYNFRRECELIKDLDREVQELNKELLLIEKTYLDNLRMLTGQSSPSEITHDPNSEQSSTDPTAPNSSSIDVERIKLQNEKLLVERSSLCALATQKMADKKAVAQSILATIAQYESKLDSDLVNFEQELKVSGDYEAPQGLPPNTEVAFKITLDSHDKTLILGQVISYRSEINSYEIIDVDDRQKYTLPDSHILELGIGETVKKIVKGDVLYALYPDTTIFYPATVVQIPKRSTSSTALSSAATSSALVPATNDLFTVTVQFHGDEDDGGTVPPRNIPLKYVVRAPQFL